MRLAIRRLWLVVLLSATLLGFVAPRGAGADGTEDALRKAKALDGEVGRLFKARKIPETIQAAREALALREGVLPADSLEVADSLSTLGVVLNSGRAFAEARTCFDRALAIRQAKLPPDDIRIAETLQNLGEVLRASGALVEAVAACERALAIAERALGADDPELGMFAIRAAFAHQVLGHFAEARRHYERGVPLAERQFGKTHPQFALILNAYGDLLLTMAARTDAVAMLARAAELVEAAYGPNDPALAVVLQNLGRAHSALGDDRKAIALQERTVAIQRKAWGPERLEVAGSLTQLSSYHANLGDYAEARSIAERAVAIAQKARADDPVVAVCLSGLAFVLDEQGGFAEPRALYERALAIEERTLGRDHIRVATTLNNLGTLLASQGARDEARPLLERAVAIWKDRLGEDHPTYGTGLSNLGACLLGLEAYDEAVPLLQRALATIERALGPDHVDLVSPLLVLAEVHRARGEVDKVRPLVERALAIRERAYGPDHPELGIPLNNLAMVLVTEGAKADAIPVFQRAARILEAASGPDAPVVGRCWMNVACACADVGRLAEARAAFAESLARTERYLRTRVGALSSAQRLAAVRQVRDRIDHWLLFAPKVGLTGFEELLRFQSLVGRVEAVERTLRRRAQGDTLALRQALQDAERRVARLANQTPRVRGPEAAAWQAEYATAAALRERLAREFTERVASARAGVERLDLARKDVQAALAADEVLVDTLRIRDRYVAWVLRPTGEPVRVELGAAQAIDAACEAFVAAVADDADDDASRDAIAKAGAEARARVWSPLEAALGDGVRRVVVCPDAALASIPFAALPGKAPGSYLAEEVAVTHVFHPFDLVPGAAGPARGAGALVVGGVDYDRADAGPKDVPQPERPPVLTSVDRAPRGGTFVPIPATRAEAEGLRDRFGREATTLLLGADATEARLREGVRGRRFVHVATHGFARTDLLAGLYDRKIQDAFLSADAERQLGAGHDPMLLSGLALAGANPREGGGGDDGILTALEASYLDLEGVDLVTLSACETAGGTAESGEGVRGLVAGFQMAGARRVVASLWKVDDEATRLLMDGLYERMLRAKDPLAPADALRESARALRARTDGSGRARFAAPRYWAAFAAYGR